VEASAPSGEWIAVGRILGAFGPRGELKVQPYSRQPQRFRTLRRVYVGEEHAPAQVLHRRPHDGHIILRLDTVRSRDAARTLHGTFLYVPEAEAVKLPEGEYFVHQIVGLEVVTEQGESLGRVAEVLSTGSNDVYVVHGPRGEVLLPATREVIREIDLDAGCLRVHLLPGLID
jgi:16S rRNA processing protein RimM